MEKQLSIIKYEVRTSGYKDYVEKDNYGAVLYAIEMDVVVDRLIEYNKFSASGITYATPCFLQSLTEVYKKDYLYCVLYGY